MVKSREIEAKTILTKVTYEKLLNAFPIKNDFIQTNYYFDTPDELLKNHNISLRIRVYADHAEQTMKIPDLNPLQKDFHEVIEITDNLLLTTVGTIIKQAEDKQLKFEGNIGKYLVTHFKAEEISQLQLITWSKTHRYLVDGPKNCELTLDATEYPDGYKDFELEIENTDPVLIKSILLELENKYNFKQTSTNTNQNKIARAVAHRK